MNGIAAAAPDAFDEPSQPSIESSEVKPVPVHWNPLLRIGFRFCFCYFALWIVCNGNATVWNAIPLYGGKFGEWLWKPLALLAVFIGKHLFHLHGVEANWVARASGDTALDWIVTGTYVGIALVGATVWTLADHRRREYQTLLAWLRFGLRLALGIAMLGYGFAKVFPLQMQPPYLAVLNEPVGQMSPMTLLWTLIGSNHWYESVCGLAEVTGGLLILYRRTALLGALVTAFVMANVVLYNFFFDVPVKIFALHLLLGAIFVTIPDWPAMFAFFWQHRPAAPAGVWVPPAERKAFRYATLLFEIVFLVLVLGQDVFFGAMTMRQLAIGSKTHSPLIGGWEVQTTAASAGAKPWLAPDQAQITRIYFDRAIGKGGLFTYTRGADGELWRGFSVFDPGKHTLTIRNGYTGPRPYTYQLEGQDRIVLTAVGPKKAPPSPGRPAFPSLTLVRIPLPTSYPLLTRGFHLVNEYGYER